ncbi:MAG: YkgJ family cysteine cluster protein [Planctomycetota bacterium]|jgi:hypothetical protein
MTKKNFGFNMNEQIIKQVQQIYDWVDEQVAGLDQSCRACGKCCDFESFGHRLYVTTPELIHFAHHLGPEIKEMPTGVCPYRIDGKCSVYPYRFTGCRIFACNGDEDKQNLLCEQAISKLKALCEEHNLEYRYVYLKVGLELLSKGQL